MPVCRDCGTAICNSVPSSASLEGGTGCPFLAELLPFPVTWVNIHLSAPLNLPSRHHNDSLGQAAGKTLDPIRTDSRVTLLPEARA